MCFHSTGIPSGSPGEIAFSTLLWLTLTAFTYSFRYSLWTVDAEPHQIGLAKPNPPAGFGQPIKAFAPTHIFLHHMEQQPDQLLSNLKEAGMDKTFFLPVSSNYILFYSTGLTH